MVRRKLNVKNLKFIPLDEVPEIRRKTQWEEVFEKIPRGQALVLTEDEASPETVRSALRRFQKDGRFKNLEGATRKLNGGRITYILHPIPDLSLPVERKTTITLATPKALPSEKEVYEYIISKPDFTHNLGEIQEKFLGGKLPRYERVLYFRLRELMSNVQGKIEKEYGGKFESTKIGREKHFAFKKT